MTDFETLVGGDAINPPDGWRLDWVDPTHGVDGEQHLGQVLPAVRALVEVRLETGPVPAAEGVLFAVHEGDEAVLVGGDPVDATRALDGCDPPRRADEVPQRPARLTTARAPSAPR